MSAPHEDVLTTFRSYGDVSGYRQAEIIWSLGSVNRLEPESQWVTAEWPRRPDAGTMVEVMQ